MALSPDDVWRANANLMAKRDSRKPKAPRAKKAKTAKPENAVVKACLQYVQMLGCFAWRNNTGGYKPYRDSEQVVHYGKTGSGDIIGMTPTGRYMEIEAKSGNNKQSEYQLAHQQKVEKHGGLYILAYSVDDVQARRREIIG